MPSKTWSLPSGPTNNRTIPGTPSTAASVDCVRYWKTPPGETLTKEPFGYRLNLPDDQLDAGAFENLIRKAGEDVAPATKLACLDEALGLWRGTAYAEFPEHFALRLEAIRLDELWVTALEQRGGLLLAIGRAADAVADMEQFVRANPHREADWAAVGTVGAGPTVLGIPQWISQLDMTAAGHDMRASIWNRLARHSRLVLYDRWATGLSQGELTDTSLEAASLPVGAPGLNLSGVPHHRTRNLMLFRLKPPEIALGSRFLQVTR